MNLKDIIQNDNLQINNQFVLSYKKNQADNIIKLLNYQNDDIWETLLNDVTDTSLDIHNDINREICITVIDGTNFDTKNIDLTISLLDGLTMSIMSIDVQINLTTSMINVSNLSGSSKRIIIKGK